MGAAHLTLDAVARRAGISKGGLLYNFPTKLSLLQAMMERYAEGILTFAEGEATEGERGATGALFKLLHSRLDIPPRAAGSKRSYGLLAAVAEHPHLLDPIRDMNRTLWQRLKERGDHETVLLAWLAIEGLIAFELFNTSPLTAAERSRLIELATQLIDGKLALVKA